MQLKRHMLSLALTFLSLAGGAAKARVEALNGGTFQPH